MPGRSALFGARRNPSSTAWAHTDGPSGRGQGSDVRRGCPGPAAQPAPGGGRHQDHLVPRRGDDDSGAVAHGRSPLDGHGARRGGEPGRDVVASLGRGARPGEPVFRAVARLWPTGDASVPIGAQPCGVLGSHPYDRRAPRGSPWELSGCCCRCCVRSPAGTGTGRAGGCSCPRCSAVRRPTGCSCVRSRWSGGSPGAPRPSHCAGPRCAASAPEHPTCWSVRSCSSPSSCSTRAGTRRRARRRRSP